MQGREPGLSAGGLPGGQYVGVGRIALDPVVRHLEQHFRHVPQQIHGPKGVRLARGGQREAIPEPPLTGSEQLRPRLDRGQPGCSRYQGQLVCSARYLFSGRARYAAPIITASNNTETSSNGTR